MGRKVLGCCTHLWRWTLFVVNLILFVSHRSGHRAWHVQWPTTLPSHTHTHTRAVGGAGAGGRGHLPGGHAERRGVHHGQRLRQRGRAAHRVGAGDAGRVCGWAAGGRCALDPRPGDCT